jgi:hypothetical protein
VPTIVDVGASDGSVRVCEKLGMRLLGTTPRWYHELSLMFWIGMHEGKQPTIGPDGPSRGLQPD